MSDSTNNSEEIGKNKESLLFEVVSLFLLVGFIYFLIQGGLVLGFRTSSPMMGVSSGSMDTEDEGWRGYYEDGNENTSEFPFQNGLQEGDLVFVRGLSSLDDIEVGEVVVFWYKGAGEKKRIIHRVAEINEAENSISTKGDDNPFLERGIYIDNVIGEAVFSVPYLGYPSVGV